METALKRAGITKYVRIHVLRGTACSWLVSQGASVVDVSRMLGHKDASITLRRYARVFDAATKRLGATFLPRGRIPSSKIDGTPR
ncbi:MAG: tyrosine-type recombinase/integrase, partial [Actinomycetales bacterium]